MLKRLSILVMFIVLCTTVYTQNSTTDTSFTTASDVSFIDTTIDYDDLFRDIDAFMDSILSPGNYLLLSISFAKGYYNYINKGNSSIDATKRFTYSPVVGYYHKGGLGITGTGYVTNTEEKTELYQASISPSYDYLHNRNLAAGISYSRYFTKDSLPFYTTPLQNELCAYFTYRKWWIKPMIAFNYGWGSRKDYSEREVSIQDLRLRRRGFTYINTEETINDFSVLVSVRHDFYWFDIIGKKDYFRVTPQLSFTSGTQKFGFNQSSITYITNLRTANNNVLFNSENLYLDDQLKFQPLSLGFNVRGEYSVGKFFVQPQIILDYYFPASSKNLSAFFACNAGFVF